MPCKYAHGLHPSISLLASPGAAPCTLFQYWLDRNRIPRWENTYSAIEFLIIHHRSSTTHAGPHPSWFWQTLRKQTSRTATKMPACKIHRTSYNQPLPPQTSVQSHLPNRHIHIYQLTTAPHKPSANASLPIFHDLPLDPSCSNTSSFPAALLLVLPSLCGLPVDHNTFIYLPPKCHLISLFI